jgi:uncharacterized protein
MTRAREIRRPIDVIGPADRVVKLDIMGDWGVANWHAVAGWLAAGMRWRTAPASRYTIHTLGEYVDSIDALLDGTVDVCVSSPRVQAHMAINGIGVFDRAHPEIRAIGVLPHRDRLLLAIGEDVAERFGIRTFADIARVKPPLTLLSAVNDGVNGIAWAAEKILEAYGIAWNDIETWGGEWRAANRPHKAIAMIVRGETDGIFFEAVMNWHAMIRRRPMRFIPIDQPVIDDLARRFGFNGVVIPAGEYEGVDYDVPTLDFSDWLVLVRADMPDAEAALLAEVMLDERPEMEKRYSHRPLKESPMLYPIEADFLCDTSPVPLHEGARAFYASRGLSPSKGAT